LRLAVAYSAIVRFSGAVVVPIMKTLFNPADHDAILKRLDALTLRHTPQWGRNGERE
jgi:hypothetical protein